DNLWNWKALSENPELPWSVELLEHYKDRWDWFYLSDNLGLPWSIELLDDYKDRWDWDVLRAEPVFLYINSARYSCPLKQLFSLLQDSDIDALMHDENYKKESSTTTSSNFESNRDIEESYSNRYNDWINGTSDPYFD
ncbi:MAG: hypothetical protein ACTHXT_15695, partial [Sphingobacterium sp.]